MIGMVSELKMGLSKAGLSVVSRMNLGGMSEDLALLSS